MADSDVIKSFFIGLGVKVDDAEIKKFVDAIGRTDKAADRSNQADRERVREEKKRAEERARRLEDFQRGAQRLALGIAAAATAAAYAVERTLAGFDKVQFASSRTGASVQNLRGLSYAFEQLGGSSAQAVSAVESFAQSMRTNPGVQGFIKSLGVATTDLKGKARDSVDVILDAVEAAKKQHPYYTGAQMAGIFGVDEASFNLLYRYGKETRAFLAERKRLAKDIGLDEQKAAQDATAFMQALRSLGTSAELVTQKIASDLSPALTGFLNQVRDWIAAHPKEIKEAFQGIGEGIQTVVTGLGGMLQKLEPLAPGFNRLTESITGEKGAHGAFKLLGEVLGGLLLFRLARVLTLITRLSALKPAAWLLSLLGVPAAVIASGLVAGGAAQASTALGKGGLTAGVDPLTGEAPSDLPGNGGVGGKGALAEYRKPWLRRQIDRGRRAVNALRPRSMRKGDRPAEDFGPAPTGLLDNIARAEGTYRTGYNTSLGHGRYLPGAKEQDLTSMTLNQILDLGNHMRRQPGNPNSSALGRYQIVGATLRDAIDALGLDPKTTKFDAATQDRIAHWIARKQGLGAWEGFKSHPQERARAAEALRRNDASGGASPRSVPPPTAASTKGVDGQEGVDIGGGKIRMPNGAIRSKTFEPNATAAPPPAADKPSASPPPPAVKKLPSIADWKLGPGSFDTEAYARARPLGSSSITNDNSRSTTLNHAPVSHVTVNGVTEPQKAADAVGRVLDTSNELSLRNAQTAIR